MTSDYPLGSGILQVRSTAGTGTGTYDPLCQNSRVVIDNFTTDNGFNRSALTTTPDTTIQIAWATPAPALGTSAGSGSWYRVSAGGTVPLIAPGVVVDSNSVRISPVLPYNFWGSSSLGEEYSVTFTTAPNYVGSIYWSNDTFHQYDVIRTNTEYRFGVFNGFPTNPPQFLRFDARDGVNHSDLNLAGTATYFRGDTGTITAGDYIRIGSGIGELHQEGIADWTVGMIGNDGKPLPQAVWNRDIVRVRFIVKFNRISSSSDNFVALTVGYNTLTIVPGQFARLTTGGGAVSLDFSDALVNVFYNAEIDIDLVAGTIGTRLYPTAGTPTGFVTAPSGGERYNGPYQPPLTIRTKNADGAPWHLSFDQIEAEVASTSPYGDPGLESVNSVIVLGGGGDSCGTNKSWPTADPNDGRAYAIGWTDGGEGPANIGTPEVDVSLVWGLFGNYGPGVGSTYYVSVASVSLPKNEPAFFGGGPLQIDQWDVFMSGEVGVRLTEHSTGIGTDQVTLLVALKSYNYGDNAPYWYDFSVLGGAEQYFTLSAQIEQPAQWTKFGPIKFQNGVSNGGKSAATNPGVNAGHVQWGLEVIGDGWSDACRTGGPWAEGFFLPNSGGYEVRMQRVQLWIQRSGSHVRAFPCSYPPAGTILVESH